MKFLVTGGAGYIGSHFVKYAQKNNHEIVVLDNFSTGHHEATNNCKILDIDLTDNIALSKGIKGMEFDCVIHFAAKSIVSESIDNPLMYMKNNFIGTFNLINEMLKNDISNIVFSSTAAVYGNPIEDNISEDHSTMPINPYGQSKLYVEKMLQDYCEASKINAVSLRYFNAAGADEDGSIGESHNPETHLIPNVLGAIKNNRPFKIFGNDYNTHDGTCIRDYIHVNDLADAHLLSSVYMKKNHGFQSFNLGNGKGFSVLEVINSCKKISGKDIDYKIHERRSGDPDTLVANSDKARKELGWKPKYKDIDQIIRTAWKWHENQKY